MDNKRTLFDFNDRLLTGTVKITVPEKMSFITKTGKLKEVPTLTKSGIPSMRNKKRTIQFEGDKFNNIIISKSGYSYNDISEFKEYKKLEKQYNELINEKEEMIKEFDRIKYKMGNRKSTKQNIEIRNSYSNKIKLLQEKIEELSLKKSNLFKKMYATSRINPRSNLEDYN